MLALRSARIGPALRAGTPASIDCVVRDATRERTRGGDDVSVRAGRSRECSDAAPREQRSRRLDRQRRRHFIACPDAIFAGFLTSCARPSAIQSTRGKEADPIGGSGPDLPQQGAGRRPARHGRAGRRRRRRVVAIAGGTDDGRLGTSAPRIAAALRSTLAASPDGVLVLLDLGSAALSLEMALEDLSTPPTRSRSR